MLYAIIAEDKANSLSLRMETRPAHIERIKELVNEGRIILAGPHPAIDTEEPGDAGFSGSLIVAEFENLKDAQSWADEDPYTKAGVFKSVTVKPFKKVLP